MALPADPTPAAALPRGARAPDAGARRSWHGGLLYAIAAVAAGSAVFAYRQNLGQPLGGPISLEKALWLNYALTAWFVVPVFLLAHPGVAPPLRTILRSFLLSMVARGLVELPLLYVTRGWDPRYGIAQDLFNIGLILVLRCRLCPRGDAFADPFNRDVRRFTTTLQLGMAAEAVFAALFYRMAVHQDGIYFAAATAEFRHINLLTRWVDLAVYADLARFLWRQRGPLFRRAGRGG